jgi:hypothetical protein
MLAHIYTVPAQPHRPLALGAFSLPCARPHEDHFGTVHFGTIHFDTVHFPPSALSGIIKGLDFVLGLCYSLNIIRSQPMPRTFTPADLMILTTGDYIAMPPADRLAYDQALVDLWVANTTAQSLSDFTHDWDRVGSSRRYETGE